jgi:hypothetical protein
MCPLTACTFGIANIEKAANTIVTIAIAIAVAKIFSFVLLSLPFDFFLFSFIFSSIFSYRNIETFRRQNLYAIGAYKVIDYSATSKLALQIDGTSTTKSQEPRILNMIPKFDAK